MVAMVRYLSVICYPAIQEHGNNEWSVFLVPTVVELLLGQFWIPSQTRSVVRHVRGRAGSKYGSEKSSAKAEKSW